MLLPKKVRRKRRTNSSSLLYSKFRIQREFIFDNYFMNEDTIALANDDDENLFLDTGTNPLRFRKEKEIDKSKNFYIQPTFWARGPGEVVRKYSGNIGFRTWPANETIRTTIWNSYKGSELQVEPNKYYKIWDELKIEKFGNESIILQDNGSKKYFMMDGPDKILVAKGSRE